MWGRYFPILQIVKCLIFGKRLEPDPLYHPHEQLLRIAEGDSAAFAVFYRNYVPVLRAYVLKFIPITSDAEDVLQAVFVRVWLSRDKLPGILNMQAWLYTITARLCMQYWRNEKLRERKIREVSTPLAEWETPFDLVQLKVLKGLIRSAIDAMPEKRRQVVYLNRNSGAGPTEIAATLSMPVGTVKNHLYEANRDIRAFLKDRGYGDLLAILLVLNIF